MLRSRFGLVTLYGSTQTTQWSQRVLRKETLPLFIIIGSGCAFAAGFGFRHLTYSPDVRVNKVSRAQSIRSNEAEGTNWVKHRESLKNAAPYVAPLDKKE